ncbi:MAG: hypothetical protein R3E79_09010 [Caldilineaceae bacterium]
MATQPATTIALAKAIRFLSLARRFTVQIGAVLERDEEYLYTQVDETLQMTLPPLIYTSAWDEGQTMTEATMAVFLLQKEHP